MRKKLQLLSKRLFRIRCETTRSAQVGSNLNFFHKTNNFLNESLFLKYHYIYSLFD